jgi:hypothetical protein
LSGKSGIAMLVMLTKLPVGLGRKSPLLGLLNWGCTVLIRLSARSWVSLQVGLLGRHPWSSPSPSDKLVGPFQIMLPLICRLVSVVLGLGMFVPPFGVRGP